MPKTIKDAIYIVMNTEPYKNWGIHEIMMTTENMNIRKVSNQDYWIQAIAKEVKDMKINKIEVDGVKNMYMGHEFSLVHD